MSTSAKAFTPRAARATPAASIAAGEPRAATAKRQGALTAVARGLRRRRLLPAVMPPAPETEADRNQERLWALLGQGAVTMKELREQGIRSPAQEMYCLQIAGYPIERFRVVDAAGESTLAYRLNRRSQAVSDEGFDQSRRDPRPIRTHTAAAIEPC